MAVRTTTKKSFKDRLMAAFKAKDEAAMEKLAGEVTEDEEPIAESDVTGSGQHIHVHVNSGAGGDAKTADEGEGSGTEKEDPFKKIGDAMEGLTKLCQDMGERLAKLEGGGSSTTDADGDEEEDDDTSTTDADGDEDEEGGKGKTKDGKTKDGKGKTRDSSGLASSFQDTIARAEILFPGIKVPTFDAKADAKKTRDTLCALRRRALDKAYATDDGKAAIDAVLAGSPLRTKDMTCDAASLLFNAASEGMKAANQRATASTGRMRVGDHGTTKPVTISDLNKAAANFWGPKA